MTKRRALPLTLFALLTALWLLYRRPEQGLPDRPPGPSLSKDSGERRLGALADGGRSSQI